MGKAPETKSESDNLHIVCERHAHSGLSGTAEYWRYDGLGGHSGRRIANSAPDTDDWE